MSQQIISVGVTSGDGLGDPGRLAFQKTNANFSELYARGLIFSASVSYAPGALVNNAAPAGFDATKNRLLITPNAGGSTLTGLVSTGFVDGQPVLVTNVSGANNLTLANANGGSLAANQFKAAGDRVIVPGQAVLIIIEVSGWRILG